MNPIYNCEKKVFSEKGKCLLCKHGHFYDKEKQICISREEAYFENMKKKQEQLPNEVDEEKGEDTNDFDKNCLLERLNNDRNCVMCRTGYYMNNKGECIYGQDKKFSSTFSFF